MPRCPHQSEIQLDGDRVSAALTTGYVPPHAPQFEPDFTISPLTGSTVHTAPPNRNLGVLTPSLKPSPCPLGSTFRTRNHTPPPRPPHPDPMPAQPDHCGGLLPGIPASHWGDSTPWLPSPLALPWPPHQCHPSPSCCVSPPRRPPSVPGTTHTPSHLQGLCTCCALHLPIYPVIFSSLGSQLLSPPPRGLSWSVLYLFIIIIFWPCRTACRILVPQPDIKPGALAVEVRSPNHWTARKFPLGQFFKVNAFFFCFHHLKKMS